MTGRGVRVAVIDSGVHAAHPHIGRIAGGVTIAESPIDEPFTDLLGHGTAVMAAIQEKAPEAEYFAVRVFRSELRTSAEILCRAIEWCINQRIDVINLSLGSENPADAEKFLPLVSRSGNHGFRTRDGGTSRLSGKPARRDRSRRGLETAAGIIRLPQRHRFPGIRISALNPGSPAGTEFARRC